MEKLQDEVIQIQIKYQKELEKLEKDNKELRKQNLLLKGGRKPTNRQIKVGMYGLVVQIRNTEKYQENRISLCFFCTEIFDWHVLRGAGRALRIRLGV